MPLKCMEKTFIDFQSVKNLFSVLLLVYYNRMQKSNFFPRKATFHSRRHDNYGSLLAKGRRRMQATVWYKYQENNHLLCMDKIFSLD